MKKILSILSAAVLITVISCKSKESAKNEAKKEDTTPTSTVSTTPVFQPYTITLVHHKVKDFDKWLPVYEAGDSTRKASGLTELGIERGLDNSNEITVAFKTDDIQKAKDFTNSPGLKEAMQKAGVIGAPTITYITVIREDNSSIEQKDRLSVVHHVKDFDTWLKAYDGEGKETRAGYGLIDRGIAREVDDPNTVHILFAISDMAKAKARAGSQELKKLMTDAGVDGPPTLNYYTLVR